VKFRSVQLPELDPHERVGGMGFRQPGMRGFLGNAQAPVAMRLRALVALSNVPARLASPLLRDLLADPAEDLRLLAYGMLDGQEKKLNGAIHAQLQARQNAASEAARAAAAAKLAGLYWELVYQGLVQGDLRRHACEQGLRHAAQALAANPEDAALYFLQGRLLHEDARPDEARVAYREALGLGLPANRVVPYMAELAYDEGDFEEVRNLLGVLRAWPDMPRLAPVVNFWDRA
jgi:tetratricopeptide (TPR) repeat protein